MLMGGVGLLGWCLMLRRPWVDVFLIRVSDDSCVGALASGGAKRVAAAP